VNEAEIEKTVLAILRQSSLIGSRRVDPAAPLGEQGLGLDSLALVKFITAVENYFSIDLPESIWIERERLTPERLGETIAGLVASTSGEPPASRPMPSVEPAAEGRKETKGVIRKSLQLLRLLARFVYKQETFHILSFDLEHERIPDYIPSQAVVCRPAGPDDLAAAKEMWPRNRRQRKLQTFMARYSAGYSCFVAEADGTIAAIDWVTSTEDRERNLGLTIRPRPDSCYGLDLYEHPGYQDKGIGMAVLLYCLRQSVEQGRRRQYTIVQSSNRKMLLTCVQLIGFTVVGRIRTRRILGFSYSTWHINGTVGRGRVLEL
jgi:acyl carrier protein/GNAT superfamily N-acetyltransferase